MYLSCRGRLREYHVIVIDRRWSRLSVLPRVCSAMNLRRLEGLLILCSILAPVACERARAPGEAPGRPEVNEKESGISPEAKEKEPSKNPPRRNGESMQQASPCRCNAGGRNLGR